MKKITSFLSLIFLYSSMFSQVSFETLSFEEALEKASLEGKYVMVVLDSWECQQCDDVADKAFADKKLGEALNEKYICIRLKREQDEWARMAQQFQVPNGMASLFFASNGVLLHRYNGTASMGKKYNDEARLAVEKEIEIININSLTTAWEQDKKDFGLLQALLLKRKDLWMSTDSLLDTYVRLLTADSVHSLTQLQFIAGLAPVLGSKADSVLRAEPDLFNQAWYRLDLPSRVRINNSIIFKTRNKAVASRDEKLARRVASFAASTNNNPVARQKSYELNMMEYYKGIRDTSVYLQHAKNYYNRFAMSISVDSILKKDSIQKQLLLEKAKGDTIRAGDKYTVKKTVQFSPSAQFYMHELNKAAWSFYTMTKDPTLINTALAWAERANVFYKSPQSLDTYARLLYLSGRKEHAIAVQTEAIALQSKLGFPTKAFDEILVSMKAGNKKIDEY